MKAVIVGNGLAGTIAAKTLRELDSGLEIDVFGEETYPYYPRPNLIEFLAGRLPFEKLFAFPESWTLRQRIAVHLGGKVSRIRPAEKTVETAAGEMFPYDVLLLGPGSRPALPPMAGSGKRGVFALRTLDDALAILDYLKDRGRALVIGGGLLGLEIARALRTRGADVVIVEFFDRLLPRQLDDAGAAILKAQIERMGIEVRLGTATEEILGNGEASGARFKGGGSAAAGLVIIAAGVRPELDLARGADLAVNRGILADDRLQTSRPDIFVAGDAAEHRGRLYGIIPASFEQARAAAYSMLKMDMPYGGTVSSNTLKVVGLTVTSAGLAIPEEAGYETLTREIPEEGIYKKIVLREGRLVGAIWMGTKKGAAEIGRLVAANKPIDHVKGELLDDGFDFGGILGS